MPGGYMGKILFVDLSKGKLKDEVLDEKLSRDFIGGYGIGARVLFSRQKAGVAPLGSDSIFGFVTGPFTGAPALSGSRYMVVGKSPLTGTWGDANSGGEFGPGLKFAGYDAVFFSGISPKPVYLLVNQGKAELRDAANLWGKDTFDTEERLKAELGKEAHVASIGPSGEKLSLIAAVMNDKGRAAARSGLGAVMGAKKLKAVAAVGDMEVPLANKSRASQARKKYLSELSPLADTWRNYGTPAFTASMAHNGDSPVKNWGGVGIVDFPDVAPIAVGPVIGLQTKKYACWRCPLGCGGRMKPGTQYKYQAGAHKPEYETLAAFGSMCLNNNLESIIKANDICNRYGLDTISAGSTIAFAIECYENGLITKEDTGGIELTWGNHAAIVAMTEKLARREGFGDILADGSKTAAEKIGKGAEQYAIHIRGQEVSMHDPKYSFPYGTTYVTDATPARHTQGSEAIIPPGLPRPAFDRRAFAGRGEAHRIGSSMHHIMNCSGMCYFMYVVLSSINAIPDFMNAITGWGVTIDELLKTGERIANIRQAFNIREGINLLQFKVPNRVLGNPPQQKGPLAGVTLDEDTMVKECLTAMDWDTKTAKPSKKKLQELGLDDVAKELWP